MATYRAAPQLQPTLQMRLEEARGRTDAIFRLVPPESLYDRPIPERHRLLFYLGHLEAFDWNLLSGPLELPSPEPALDKLFAFGIDPVDGGLPTDVPSDWPTVTRIQKYNQRVRNALDQALNDSRASRSSDTDLTDGTLLHVAIEHRLMHAETLAYLLHNLPLDRKNPHAAPVADLRPSPMPRRVAIPAGVATLGMPRGTAFGWDNEFETQEIEVPSFSIDVYPITNGEYLKFVEASGYDESRYWSADDWKWKSCANIEHPHFWTRRAVASGEAAAGNWEYRAMFGRIPLPLSWPVYVSHAEASAYARWAGTSLPTEAQWHRAAYGAHDQTESSYPWGEARPNATRGNFHFKSWDAAPVDAHPAGASAFGVFDMLGNGWEWTSTIFGPLPGFKPFSFYPGYSANFFDGKHFVMKGGSPQTDECMLRRTFRNWFQPHYPYVYATFRCVEE
ncbi:MAG TPA: SUMF1/EgtB/PvdO family nonheme iron enzyme [Candidatus Acidoferrales bacterium]|nr:SUMF1/EgtB/PvdO family nonheme iron enzyme [Candidatus Acidoferrales bacterium]